MGEWAPPFFYSASPTPPWGLWGDRLWLMGGRGVVNLDGNPVNIRVTRPGTVWMHSIYSCESFSFIFALGAHAFLRWGAVSLLGFWYLCI